MKKELPSNIEMYKLIFLRQEFASSPIPAPVIHGARNHWDELVAFSSQRGLLEPGFATQVRDHFHQSFWELYLPKAFHSVGITLDRLNSAAGGPDFNFGPKCRRIWIEAVACGEASNANVIYLPSNDPDDFESGFAPEHQIMQRLASAISTKVQQWKGHKNRFGPDDQYVIAVNGFRALCGYPHDQVPFAPPFIVRTLFGLGDCRMSKEGPYYEYMEKTPGKTPLAHFLNPDIRGIAGVLYSDTSVWEPALPLGHDFTYIQNPHAPDLTPIFSFCQAGRWIRRATRAGKAVVTRIPFQAIGSALQ